MLAKPFNALANAVVLFSCAVGVALIGLLRKRALLAVTIDMDDRGAESLAAVQAPRAPLPVVLRETPPTPDTGAGTAFERIRERGTLRGGYVMDRPPFAFRNGAGALVGMDVELARRLGRDPGVAQVGRGPHRATALVGAAQRAGLAGRARAGG